MNFNIITKVAATAQQLALVLKNGHKSKTVIFGALLVVLGGVQSILPDIAIYMGAYGPLVTQVVGAVVILLRAFTTTPLEEK